MAAIESLDDLRWLLAVLAAVFGLIAFLLNYRLILSWLLRRKRGSMIPLYGGGCLALSLLLVPIAGLAYYAWLPLVLDPGCLLMVVCVVYILMHQTPQKRNESPPKNES